MAWLGPLAGSGYQAACAASTTGTVRCLEDKGCHGAEGARAVHACPSFQGVTWRQCHELVHCGTDVSCVSKGFYGGRHVVFVGQGVETDMHNTMPLI